jgi:hypothetical protein
MFAILFQSVGALKRWVANSEVPDEGFRSLTTAIVRHRLPPHIDEAACRTHYERIAPGSTNQPRAQHARGRAAASRCEPGSSLDPNTPQTPVMNRTAAINYARIGAQKSGPAR